MGCVIELVDHSDWDVDIAAVVLAAVVLHGA
jgi:hypothetical protein